MEVTSAILFLLEIYYIVVNFSRQLILTRNGSFFYKLDVRRHFQFLTQLGDFPRDLNEVRNDAIRLAPP